MRNIYLWFSRQQKYFIPVVPAPPKLGGIAAIRDLRSLNHKCTFPDFPLHISWRRSLCISMAWTWDVLFIQTFLPYHLNIITCPRFPHHLLLSATLSLLTHSVLATLCGLVTFGLGEQWQQFRRNNYRALELPLFQSWWDCETAQLDDEDVCSVQIRIFYGLRNCTAH